MMLFRQTWALYRMKYLQEKKVSPARWQEELDLRPAFLEKRYRQYLPHYTRGELGNRWKFWPRPINTANPARWVSP